MPARALPGAGSAEGSFEEQPQASFAADADEVVVAFESEPAGASVLLDGQLLCRETPCKKRLFVGAHAASFQKERYASSAMSFTAAKGATVKATLAPQFGWVQVETTPSGVGVAIDGSDAGRSPISWREVDAGGASAVGTVGNLQH